MQQGTVIGHATSTIKHPSLNGWRLLIVQPMGIQNQPEGTPVVAIEKLGAAVGQKVVISSDGRGVRELIGDPKSPARWFVVGIVDE
jgi:ethanolamine utilization protein EutN